MVSESEKIVEHFNTYFTSIDSVSLSNKNDSVKFIENYFNKLKKSSTLITDSEGFKFSRVTCNEVKSAFNNVSSSSSPGKPRKFNLKIGKKFTYFYHFLLVFTHFY